MLRAFLATILAIALTVLSTAMVTVALAGQGVGIWFFLLMLGAWWVVSWHQVGKWGKA